eukprot:TRINITY_DN8256_c0_g1_i2.p1 TRINITY_DN8256_c0_g1~~TRINITY_DN8256_c0_g1_i2.p1  ORF type:complete len:327 (-),score=90.93 TRINITY_DN8256_c0_g1_i2:34-1014(-)
MIGKALSFVEKLIGHGFLYQLIMLIGVAVAAYYAWRFFWIFVEVVVIRRDKSYFANRYGAGTWAVVTGGSYGIGKGWVTELARNGFNVIIIARNAKKVEALCKTLEAEFGIKTHAIIVNFRKAGEDGFFEKIAEELKKFDVSILVNNVGFLEVDEYLDLKPEDIRDMITVNIYPIALLTKHLVGQLLARTKRSGIVNMSSVAALAPMPLNTPYSASKVFSDFYSRALQLEIGDKIDILTLRPGPVQTAMTCDVMFPLGLTPTEAAASSLKLLGFSKLSYGGHWRLQFWGLILEHLPPFLQSLISQVLIRSGPVSYTHLTLPTIYSV